MKKYVFVLALIIAVVAAGCAQHMSAKEIADKMLEKSKEIKSYEADMVLKLEMNGRTTVDRSHVIFEKPNKIYMHNEHTGIVMVSNGKKLWIYNEKNNEFSVMNVTPELNKTLRHKLLQDFVEYILKNYNMKYAGEKSFDGKKCYVMNLTSINSTGYSPKHVEIWVDEEYWMPVKEVTVFKNKYMNMTMVLEYRNLSINCKIDESVFNFTPPRGAKMINSTQQAEIKYNSFEEAQKHVNYTLIVPKYTAGLKLKCIIVQKSTVYAEYVNGKNNSKVGLTIIELPKAMSAPPNAKNVSIGGKNVTEWRTVFGRVLVFKFSKNNVSVIVMSSTLSKDELVKVVNSMLE
ncbi:MAG: hypothetical protein DSY33_01200 [Archaeoglobus sp.]|nr:MAG: hypothetical protein DSY33_01200 [Archaeoglobus sp.]